GEHFVGEFRAKKRFFAECAVENERGGHSPVGSDLAQPLVLLCAVSHFDFEVVGGGAGRKLVAPPATCFAHFGFLAQAIELNDQARVLSSIIVAHRSSDEPTNRVRKIYEAT